MNFQYLKNVLFFLLLCGAFFPVFTQAKLNMLVDWKYDQKNNTMNFTIKQAYDSGNNYKISCSIISPCYMAMTYSSNVGYPWKHKISKYGLLPLSVEDIVYSFNKEAPVSGSMPVYHENDTCYMVAILQGNSERGYYLGSTCDGSINPPEPPKPEVSCSMSGNIDLRHGSLADSEVTGNRAESTAYVYCSGAAKVKVRALASVGSDSYTVNLRADGSLKSMLSVNGVVGNAGVTLDVPGGGWKAATFSSLLIAAGTPAPGDFSGSAVAVVDVL
ncbi:hypothetical protein OX886_22990 [Serratia marcescens]|uniref:MrpH family fimbial adhesin n=2 Tax=Pseudomonadota TaxID=1224 RepID=UPI00217AD39A|nr:hypothetical protein [Serratia marcescens]CAI1763411.1 Uncharacterised protein [Serratia marcescens]